MSHYPPFALPLPSLPLQNVELTPSLGPRQPVSGTDTSLCPPHDFSWNAYNRAWESPHQEARIKVLQFRDQSFYQRRERLEQLLLSNNDLVDRLDRRESSHRSYESLQLSFRRSIPTLLTDQPEIACHRALAFGDDKVLVLATAHYPAHFSAHREGELLASLHSIIYHPQGIYGHWPSHARFSLDLSSTHLVGIPPRQVSPNGPFLFQSHPHSPHPGLQICIEVKEGRPDKPKDVLERLFQRNFFSSYYILDVQPVVVGAIQGYEAFAIEHVSQQGLQRLEYAAVLLRDTDHVTFLCQAPDDRISHLGIFRKLLYSFQPA